MSQPVRIDFVSDIACPWCVIGLLALEKAIERVGDALQVDLRFRAFELNPAMPVEGEDAIEHLTRKYGITAEQARANGEAIRLRGAELGFEFDIAGRSRIRNTFDAHRLLYWAGKQGAGQQLALKHGLLRAYFSDAQDVSDTDVLARLAGSAGLDADMAREILGSGKFADDVRAEMAHYRELGISAVPSVIFNGRHLVQGGQPVESFEQALRKLAAD